MNRIHTEFKTIMNRPYIPDTLPIQHLDYRRLIGLVGAANAELARYDGLLQGIPNPDIMLSPLTTQEAVLSSRIEGTQATLDDVLEQEAGLQKDKERRHDIQEIINYQHTLINSREALADAPITLHLIREMHRVLMNSVRGQDKLPGVFRKDQNWIGPPGVSIESATYIPPDPLLMEDALQNWMAYAQGDDLDPLIQTAVVHAQFELIHPFMDGNGRIGRLLIPLFLFYKRRLSAPMFYMSAYLEQHRSEYYARLNAISVHNDWNSWIEFFLHGVHHQAEDNIRRIQAIMELYERTKATVATSTGSKYAIRLIEGLFNQPIFRTSDFIKHTGIPKQSAIPLLGKIKKTGLLITVREARGRRSSIMAFPELLKIVVDNSKLHS